MTAAQLDLTSIPSRFREALEVRLGRPLAVRERGDWCSGALFGLDEAYRYALWRTWDPARVSLVVIGLNPSTADEREDDPTIRRCINFAKRDGFGGLVMLNLFALRSTDPAALYRHAEPVGLENEAVIRAVCQGRRDGVVAAWGVHGAFRNRERWATNTLPVLECFGVTKAGHPKHPLYLRGDTPRIPFPRTTPGTPAGV